jgi:hypothetical protein
MTEEKANEIYDELVSVCGAPKGYRADFIASYTRERYPTAWRFQGKLGFGGKFWVRGDQWFVNCYKEDITPERQEIIDVANKVLEEIPHD